MFLRDKRLNLAKRWIRLATILGFVGLVCWLVMHCRLAAAGFDPFRTFATNRAVVKLPPSAVHQPTSASAPNASAVGYTATALGLVSWWPFDGNANDFQMTHNLNLDGTPVFTSGNVMQALSFDGVNDDAWTNGTAATNVGGGNGFTIDLWIKPTDLAVSRPIVEWNTFQSTDPNFGIGVHLWQSVTFGGAQGPGNLYASIVDTSGTNHILSSAPNMLVENAYQHIALTYDKALNRATLYINSNNVGAVSFGPAFTPWTTPTLYFGTRPGGYYFKGQMDEIDLFNRALSQAEIQAIYNAGSAGKCKIRYVTNTNDSGAGSLRLAIINSNNYGAPNTIGFNIGNGGVQTISPTSALPDINGPVTIDGTSQPGYAGTPLIELNGAGAGFVWGLRCNAPVTIKGLVINRFSSLTFGWGIWLSQGSAGSTIIGNYIGTDPTGNFARGNQHGIRIDSSNNVIGGPTAAERNLISGNDENAIVTGNVLFGWPEIGNANLIQGNYIGTNAIGNAALGNNSNGMYIISSNNTIKQNVIAANGSHGIRMSVIFSLSTTPPTTGNLIQGNFIGTDASGTLDLGNIGDGINLFSQVSNVQVNNNTIGGTASGTRNIISGNGGDGIYLSSSAVENFVRGNYIGTDVTGTQAIGNSSDGVRTDGGNTQIGGAMSAERNIISGNGGAGVVLAAAGNFVQGNYIGTNAAGTQGLGNVTRGVQVTAGNNQISGNVISANGLLGIEINGSSATQNIVQDNYIGTNAAGTGNLGNAGIGVWLVSASNNLIGGTASGAGNRIGYNAGSGVHVGGGSGTRNTIEGNSIFSNGLNPNLISLGIDLAPPFGPTANDGGDGDTGPNNLQNFPVLTSATSYGGNTLIQGTLNSTANRGFRIEIFSNNACHSSGYGEGQTFLGSINVTTVGNNASFSLSVPTTSIIGTFLTATATDAATGDTSEFSQCLAFNNPCPTITLAPPNLPNGFVGVTYPSQTFSAAGGTAPYGFSVSTGTLPSGLNLVGDILSGTPTATGTFNFTVKATDNLGCQGFQAYSVTINNSGTGTANLQFYPLAHPVRLLDTRPGQTGCDAPGAMIPGGTSRAQTAAGRTCDGLTIPANARVLTGNITTVESGGGFLTLYPSDVPRPLVANSNFAANQILNNVFTVGLGAADGAFNIYVTTNTNVVVDVTGYYAPPSVGGLYFHPLPHPVRLMDSRPGATACFTPGVQQAAGSTTAQLGTTTCDGVLIPGGAQALVGNATTVNSQANGFLTLFPANAMRPLAASSNFQAGINMNAPLTVGLSPSGQFNIYAAATTDLVVDVLGYFSAQLNDSNGQGLLFNPLPAPVRLLDTRPGQSGCFTPGLQMLGGGLYLQPVPGVCTGIPITAKAVVGNATTVNVTANGFLTFWADGNNRPLIATSNYRSGTVFNRHFIVGVGLDGAFRRYASTTTDLVIDLSGYFAP